MLDVSEKEYNKIDFAMKCLSILWVRLGETEAV